jgi:hypothetical protein
VFLLLLQRWHTVVAHHCRTYYQDVKIAIEILLDLGWKILDISTGARIGLRWCLTLRVYRNGGSTIETTAKFL